MVQLAPRFVSLLALAAAGSVLTFPVAAAPVARRDPLGLADIVSDMLDRLGPIGLRARGLAQASAPKSSSAGARAGSGAPAGRAVTAALPVATVVVETRDCGDAERTARVARSRIVGRAPSHHHHDPHASSEDSHLLVVERAVPTPPAPLATPTSRPDTANITAPLPPPGMFAANGTFLGTPPVFNVTEVDAHANGTGLAIPAGANGSYVVAPRIGTVVLPHADEKVAPAAAAVPGHAESVRRDGSLQERVPGSVDIMSPVANASAPGVRLASLVLAPNGTAGGYALEASAHNHTQLFLVVAPPLDGLAAPLSMVEDAAEVPVQLQLDVFDAAHAMQVAWCATYDPQPEDETVLGVEACQITGEAAAHKSQTFLWNKETSAIRPMFFNGQDDDMKDSITPASTDSTDVPSVAVIAKAQADALEGSDDGMDHSAVASTVQPGDSMPSFEAVSTESNPPAIMGARAAPVSRRASGSQQRNVTLVFTPDVPQIMSVNDGAPAAISSAATSSTKAAPSASSRSVMSSATSSASSTASATASTSASASASRLSVVASSTEATIGGAEATSTASAALSASVTTSSASASTVSSSSSAQASGSSIAPSSSASSLVAAEATSSASPSVTATVSPSMGSSTATTSTSALASASASSSATPSAPVIGTMGVALVDASSALPSASVASVSASAPITLPTSAAASASSLPSASLPSVSVAAASAPAPSGAASAPAAPAMTPVSTAPYMWRFKRDA